MKKLLLKSIILFACLFIADESYSQLAVSATVGGNVLCNGLSDGYASANASGGSLPYLYSWNPSGQTHQMATGLSAGNYTVTVTDGIGATAIATVAILQPAALSLTSTSTFSCITLTGTATVNVSGGTPSYTYSWNASPPQNTQTATGLAAGS